MAKLPIILFIFSGLFAVQWEHELTKGGIKVWSRDVEGSYFKEIKAVGWVPAPPTRIFEGLQERKKLLKVMKFMTDSKELGSCGTNCKYVYQAFQKKPIKTRHVVIKVQWEESGDDEASKVIKQWWTKAKNKKPEGNGVEMHAAHGSWHLVASAGGTKTKVTTISYVDPGHVTPFAYFVNQGGNEIAWDFLDNLRKLAPKW